MLKHEALILDWAEGLLATQNNGNGDGYGDGDGDGNGNKLEGMQ